MERKVSFEYFLWGFSLDYSLSRTESKAPPCYISRWWIPLLWTCWERGNLPGGSAHAPFLEKHLEFSQGAVSACTSAANCENLLNRKVQLYRRRPCGVENGVVAEEPFAPLQSDIYGTKTHQLAINVSFSPGYNILCSFSFGSHLTTNLDFYWVCAVFDSSATSCDSHVYSLALYTLYCCGQSRRPLSKYDSQYWFRRLLVI